MKLTILPFLLAAAPAFAQAPPAADQAALTALAAEADAAWNVKDADRMAANYADTGTLRLSGGQAIVGREAIRTVFKSNFAARQGVLRHITTIDRAELVDPDLALSDAAVRIEQQGADGQWKLVRSFRNVTLARREAGQWKLAAVRAIMVPNPS